MELNMTYIGKVKNGTVELPPEAHLPEGASVRVEPITPETLAARLGNLVGAVDDMPSDWAENHDHYVHGTEKK
jgi:hypothetical protein